MMTTKIQLLWLLAVAAVLFSCKKDFLDTRPDKAVLVPATPGDFQAVLDNTAVMNLVPEIGLIASDDFYTTAEGLQGLYTQTEKGSYAWAADPYQGETVGDWNTPYQQVFYCNVVLEGLSAATDQSARGFDALRGSALFYRGMAYYQLSQLFAAPYDPATADHEMGIPLKATADIHEKITRGTLAQTYAQLLGDLQSAVPLLPLRAAYKSRPNRAAAYGLLARIYLGMGIYDRAGAYADSSLRLNGRLNNYAAFNPADYRPFPLALPDNNDEIDFDTSLLPYGFDESALTFADSALYKTYEANDLRKSLFFVDSGLGGMNFQGSYSGTYFLFGGIATDELYLIRAEAEARTGHPDASAADLNSLLVTRWKTGTYIPVAPGDPSLLAKILAERRKELVGRGTRWTDLRRLNRDPRFAVTLKRVTAGKAAVLAPQDQRYAFPIPDDELRLSGIPQNPR